MGQSIAEKKGFQNVRSRIAASSGLMTDRIRIRREFSWFCYDGQFARGNTSDKTK